MMDQPNTPIPDQILIRIESLRAMANEGTLSADEHAEYKSLIESLDLLAILQAKDRENLDLSAS